MAAILRTAEQRGERAGARAQTPERLRSRRLDAAIWLLVALVAGTVLIGVAFGPFRLDARSFLAPAGACAALGAAACYYRRRRRDEERLACALEGTAQLTAFAAVG
ncbi:MAG: hypothetical protein HY056_14200, partial [Proteobacteria bacterium]|nr:hypothetical protein [Pseudomonadota bacterium]